MTSEAAENRPIIFSIKKVTAVCPKQGAIPYRAWPTIPDKHASKQTNSSLLYYTCRYVYMEIARDLVNERKLASFLTLTGGSGTASPIVSLLQKYRRLCHPRIKQKVAVIARVNVAASK